MPKQRFYNLPSEKRERILNSAISEFSRVPVNEVSINKIIKGANISRGSFYQYFEDKNDLIREIISDYGNNTIKVIEEHLRYKDRDIFNASIELLNQTITFMNQSNNQKLCFFLFDAMKGNEDFLHKIISTKEVNDIIDMIISLADTSNFKYSTRSDIVNVLDIITAIGSKTIMKVIKQPQNTSTIIEDFKRQMTIIQTGILIEK
jgi:AcrR family transcriptional regulator